MITINQLRSIIKTNPEPEKWLDPINKFFKKYDIETVDQMAGFLAQTSHESSDFTSLNENMSYSATRLMKVWPKRFPSLEVANHFAKNPEKLANQVYSDRMGNGSPESGDGWRFKGRGIKQLTGRYNYTEFGKTVDMTAEEAVAYVATISGAVESACWFWKTNNLNAVAHDIIKMTKIINGGLINIEDRKARYIRAKSILGSLEVKSENGIILKIGSKGSLVKSVQSKLDLTPDGSFGPNTELQVKKWQEKVGYSITGSLTQKQIDEILE